MKNLPKVLLAVGLLGVLLAFVGGVMNMPSKVVGIRVSTVLGFANTCFLLAIIAKLFEKK